MPNLLYQFDNSIRLPPALHVNFDHSSNKEGETTELFERSNNLWARQMVNLASAILWN